MGHEAFAKILDTIPSEEKQCINALISEWKNKPPLTSKKVLINCHLTNATLLLIKLFLFSGAELFVTCSVGLVCHEPIKNMVERENIYIAPETLLSQNYNHYFDLVLDCGGHFANTLFPQNGFIELTHVDESRYVKTECPVISVDKSILKEIETTFGTGDGFVRAIKKIYAKNSDDFRTKNFLIFGFGKVGAGIAECLAIAGVSKHNIYIVELNAIKIKLAQAKGFISYNINHHLKRIDSLLQSTINCAITATGIQNSITHFLKLSHFSHVDYLANMGTFDEWGESFPEHSILYNKQPLNFMLDYPTKMQFLDPVFALLACATIEMNTNVLERKFSINKPNVETEQKIINLWKKSNLPNINIINHLKKIEAMSLSIV